MHFKHLIVKGVNPYIYEKRNKIINAVLIFICVLLVSASAVLLFRQTDISTGVTNYAYKLVIIISDLIKFEREHEYAPNIYSSIDVEIVDNRQEVLGINDLDFVEEKLQMTIRSVDSRAYILDKFFASKNSPLEGYGSSFVKYCDQFGAPEECITIPAISFAETNYCKYDFAIAINNCWGFGGGGSRSFKFETMDEAIEFVTNRLVNSYGQAFLEDPSIGVRTYCGNGPECRNWSLAVRNGMDDIRNFSRKHGLEEYL